MKRAARIDANQTAVVEALRAAGATVHSLAAVGNGVPDLLVGFNGQTLLFEVKDGDKSPSRQKLTAHQKQWHENWQGGVLQIVDGPASALLILEILA